MALKGQGPPLPADCEGTEQNRNGRPWKRNTAKSGRAGDGQRGEFENGPVSEFDFFC